MSLELLGARSRSSLGADYVAAPSLEDVRAGRAVIREGMRGAPVEYVQKKAGLTGKDLSGLFDGGTTAAVKRFQAGMELPGGGIVNKDTLEALDGAYIVEEKTPAPSSLLEITRFPVPAAPPKPAAAPAKPAAAPAKSAGSSFLDTLKSLFSSPAAAPVTPYQPLPPVQPSIVPYVAGGAGLLAILLALILRRSS